MVTEKLSNFMWVCQKIFLFFVVVNLEICPTISPFDKWYRSGPTIINPINNWLKYTWTYKLKSIALFDVSFCFK